MNARHRTAGWLVVALVAGVLVPASATAAGDALRPLDELVPIGEHAISYGVSVAIDNGVAVVADPGRANGGLGQVHLFAEGADGRWVETGTLLSPEETATEVSGISVAIDGGVIVVGAVGFEDRRATSGLAYVFERQADGSWVEVTRLVGSDSEGSDYFGDAVAVDGSVMVVGAPTDDDDGTSSGSMFVFERLADGGWVETAKLTAEDASGLDYLGSSVAVDGDVAVAGAWGSNDDGTDSGATYVFERQADGVWGQTAKLTASDAAAYDYFGNAVAADSGTIAVTSLDDDDLGNRSGSAYLFTRGAGGAWEESAKLTASDGSQTHRFGRSLAFDGDVLVVSSDQGGQNGEIGGAAYVFHQQPDGTWKEEARLSPERTEPTRQPIVAVDVHRGTAVLGAGLGWRHEPGLAFVFDTGLSKPVIIPGQVTLDPEGDGRSTLVEVPVRLSEASSRHVTVDYRTVDATATAPGDYQAATGTVTFMPGETEKGVQVEIAGDHLHEALETVLVAFSNPRNAQVGGFYGLGFIAIVDDDDPPILVPGVALAREGHGDPLRIPVRLSQASGRTVTVQWRAFDVTAVAGADYMAASGTLAIPAGAVQGEIEIELIDDDVAETPEAVAVALEDPVGATVGGFFGLGVGLILDDD